MTYTTKIKACDGIGVRSSDTLACREYPSTMIVGGVSLGKVV